MSVNSAAVIQNDTLRLQVRDVHAGVNAVAQPGFGRLAQAFRGQAVIGAVQRAPAARGKRTSYRSQLYSMRGLIQSNWTRVRSLP